MFEDPLLYPDGASREHSPHEGGGGGAGGDWSEITAHLREAKGFGRDAFESFSKGQVKQGAVEAFGSALNTAGAAFKSTFTPTPAEKLGNDPW